MMKDIWKMQTLHQNNKRKKSENMNTEEKWLTKWEYEWKIFRKIVFERRKCVKEFYVENDSVTPAL